MSECSKECGLLIQYELCLLERAGESDASTCCVAKQAASVYGESSSEAQSFLQAIKAIRGFGADADVAAWIGEGTEVSAEPFLP